jgi:uncharacterized protein (DUF2237 family)
MTGYFRDGNTISADSGTQVCAIVTNEFLYSLKKEMI